MRAALYVISGALLAALTASAAAASPPGVDCFVQCKYKEGKPDDSRPVMCVVNTPGKVEHVGTRARALIARCNEARLASGAVLDGLFRSARGMETFRIEHVWGPNPSPPFANLVPNLKNGRCTGPACAEAVDVARIAGVGGKGIDGVVSRRVGQPCAIGLPCGTILRPSGPLVFQMPPEAPAAGRLQVTALRGARGASSAAVVDRRVEWPPGTLQNGAAYAYALFNDAGAEVAAGEFQVLSAKMQADVEADIAELKRKDPSLASLAFIEILLDHKLEWDAVQASR